jgi:hypothetical protein
MKTTKPDIEIATIFRDYDHLLGRLPRQHHKVIQAIKNCRTEVLGGHQLECNSCDYTKNAYNSCRNRHCPKCGFTARTRWIEKRCDELLDCPYFHVVFTIPSELRLLFLMNQKLCYNFLFEASSKTIKEVAKNPDNLGAEVGSIGVLHTWGQNLMNHPHIHFIVPGGGLSSDRKMWVKVDEKFLLPVKILSKVFKAKLLDLLELAYKEDKFNLISDLERFKCPAQFDDLIKSCAYKNFIVYCKKPFAGPQAVIKYLGGYTHRIAISNFRLVKIEEDRVYFKVRDKSDPSKKKIMSLDVKEFMRRYLLHVLPKGFVRIRHFGLLANRYKKVKVEIIRKLQGLKQQLQDAIEKTWKEVLIEAIGKDPDKCPSCSGVLGVRRDFTPLISSA